jgi:NADH dehydrogenase FAD-containing subunit
VPGLAPAAKQGGCYVADVIMATALGSSKPPPFRYRHQGNLATIGRHAAIADFGRIKLTGALAWWLWGLAHIYFLIGVRAPMLVAAQWFWAYLTFGCGARLITGLAPLFEKPQDTASHK